MFLVGYLILLAFYLLFNLLLARGWKSIPVEGTVAREESFYFTIIITVRNEEENIGQLLRDLESQNYPSNQFEVFIYNDHSTDKTCEIIEEYRSSSSLNISLFHLPDSINSPKKTAIRLGVSAAKGSWVLITDGDCSLPKSWISSYAHLIKKRGVDFIFGPVAFQNDQSFLNTVLSIEFASLIGAGASALFYKKPIMCNAANLGFSKEAFQAVGGYTDNESVASGDDVFLMHKIFNRNPVSVSFLKNRGALVLTHHEKSFKNFVNQRIRWASKWKLTGGIIHRLVPVFIFIFHLATLIFYAYGFTGKMAALTVTLAILVKACGEYLFIQKVMSFMIRKATMVHYLAASLIYPFYAVFFGIAANFGVYTWKDRTYRNKK